MTVTYNSDVNTAGFTTFIQLFFRWKGSLWKAVYKELFLWLFFYALLGLAYRFVMSESQKRIFESVCVFFARYVDYIPLTFMLGFFVSLVVDRWMNMAANLGFVDLTAMHVCTYISAIDERGIMLRRTILRYILFFQVLAYRTMSEVILNRFPTLESFVAAGYITTEELQIFTDIEKNKSPVTQLWVPLKWAFDLVKTARNENRITDHGVQDLYKRFVEFRGNLGTLLGYDWIPIPLLYTQVVCLTVRLYFIIALLGRQDLDKAPDEKYVDDLKIYVPVMTIFQFVFYMGWMKVAEALLNPLGDDDDDFEVNFLLDRNLQVAMAMAGTTQYPILLGYDQHYCRPMMGSALQHAQQEGRLQKSSTTGSVIMLPREDTTTIDDDDDKHSFASLHSGVFDAVKRRLSVITGTVYPEDEEGVIRKRKTSATSSVNSSAQNTLHKKLSKPDPDAPLDIIARFQRDLENRPKSGSARTVTDLPVLTEEDEHSGSHKSLKEQPSASQDTVHSVQSCSMMLGSDSARSSFNPIRPFVPRALQRSTSQDKTKKEEPKEFVL
ncbi:hypothetical protein L596_022491 [Steinernema carpocapsae]|uniref:Bestrophin homolog n=1 Tax=Steinernema carpocapsae TaxID=34508 RepID=A0A4U5MMQ5_STECR|nr:hypothetical protein L596_022491 [Steinernema carpocapsae]